jgi:hypothetical protein
MRLPARDAATRYEPHVSSPDRAMFSWFQRRSRAMCRHAVARALRSATTASALMVLMPKMMMRTMRMTVIGSPFRRV